MAYNNQSSGNRFGNKPAASSASAAKPAARDGAPRTKADVLLSSGLFKPKSEKSKALASVVTTVEQDIPAGTAIYIDVYANEEVIEGKPTHKVQIKKRA
jgi:hypothetical protein